MKNYKRKTTKCIEEKIKLKISCVYKLKIKWLSKEKVIMHRMHVCKVIYMCHGATNTRPAEISMRMHSHTRFPTRNVAGDGLIVAAIHRWTNS